MAIRKFTDSWNAIRNLSVQRRNDDRYAVSLNCSAATAYLFCVTREGVVSFERLQEYMTDAKLIEMCSEPVYEAKLDEYTLYCVNAQYFHASSSFNDLPLKPPVCMQVFAIQGQGVGHVLYYPGTEQLLNAQMAFIPLEYLYAVSQSKRKEVLELRIRLEPNEGYQDGALLYQIGNLDPIPIPRSWIDRPIPLNASLGSSVTVLVDKEYRGRYCQRR